MPENAKQRLVDLSVGEISLVDMPANEEEFMVIKSMNMAARGFVEMSMEMLHRIEEMGIRLVNDGMADGLPVSEVMTHVRACADKLKAQAFMEKAQSGCDSGQETTKKSKEKSMADPVIKDEQPTANDKLVDDISAAAEGLVSALEKAKAGGKGKMPPWMEEDDEDDMKDGKKGKGKVKKDMPEPLSKSLNTLSGAIGKLLGTQPVEVKKEEEQPKPPEESPTGGTTIQVMPDGAVVIKGARQFTKERISRLKDSLGNLLGLVKDADPDAYTEMLAGLNAELKDQTAAKSEVAKAKDGTPTEEPPAWFKAAMDKVTEVATSVEDVTKRLDQMEKGQAVSKSLPEGGTDKPVAKDKSFWHGVL